MTLEDFFTLTEMKDGLTAPSRVQELVSVMQKEQDCVVKNAGDATRQWADVASTITATENKDCLDLFIQLDGLWFINRWLNDAQNFGADANDGFIEESITAMLRAVEKLHLDSKKSISSGIQGTVSNLLGHHSSRVQDKARLLVDSWKEGGNGDAESHDMDPVRANNASHKIFREEDKPSAVNEAGNDDDCHASRLVGGEKTLLRSSDSLLPEKVASVQIQSSDNALQSSVSLDFEDIKERSNHLANASTSVQEAAPQSESETTLAGTCIFPIPKQGSFKGQPDDLQLNDLSKKVKQDQNISGPSEKIEAPDSTLASIKPAPGPVSVDASEAKALESVKEEPALEHNVENNDGGVCHRIIVSDSTRTPASDRKSGVDDVRAINSSNLHLSKASKTDSECCNALQDSSVNGGNMVKPEVLEMSFIKTEKEGKGQVSNQSNNASNGSGSFKWGKGSRSPNIIDKSSDIEFGYGIDDALEVARQVAHKVEREISSPYDRAEEEGKGRVSNQGNDASNALQDSSVSGGNVVKPEVLEMSFVKTEYDRTEKEGKGQVSNQSNNASNGSGSFKWGKGSRSPNIIDKSSDIEFGYGIDDALEVARQVAQEVEREISSPYDRAEKEGKGRVSNQGNDASNGSGSFKWVKGRRSPNFIDKSSDIELEYGIVDALEYAQQVAQEVEREVRSSSSEKISEGRIRQLGSPDSVEKKDELTHVLPEEVSSRQSNSAEACFEGEGHTSISNDIEAEPECIPDLESSQVTEAARDPGGNSEKSLCTFDLNEEVGSDDMDVYVNAMSTTPIPVVSVSKPAQTSGLPTTPLQFEGTLGWKGSAATSAFRPASPRKIFDSEKNVSVSGSSDISKQRQGVLDIDLNVAEGEEGLTKRIGESSSLPSVQSSVELSPKRSSRLELDLNIIGDDGDTQPSDHRMEGKFFSGRNGYWSPSPASSSSSMQPSVRNIDLNDRPYLQTDLVDQGPSKSSIIDAYGRPKSDVPVISILGAKVEVGRREYVPQNLSLPNGKAIEPAADLTMSGAGGILGMTPTISYNHSTVFGYNGLTPTPPLPFSSVMYGSGGTIPYMVDSRGAPVVPQVGGSSSTVVTSYTQPPFIMNMTGTQLGLNGVGPSRPNFDLNSGFMIDGGNRDTLAARQFFFPAQGRAMEEHVRTIPQSSSSGFGGKRKEPDSDWDTYPFYKHPQPPWK